MAPTTTTMTQHPRHANTIGEDVVSVDFDLDWPFENIDGLHRDHFRDAAYEIFFTACRSSPGFGGRTAISYHNPSEGGDGSGSGAGSTSPGSPVKPSGVGMAVTSKVKTALGLKMLKRSRSRRTSSYGGTPSSPGGGTSPKVAFTVPHTRARRPMTSAEIMRRQMRVSEQSDSRLRKTLMRTLVGQMGRRAETIILPLELLRHLKPSEFNDTHEYHQWQKRQLRILEAGLLLHPSIPVERSNTFAKRFREIIKLAENKAIDTGKNSETMRALCNSVVSLAWRTVDGSPTDICHWADGFPLNIHIYSALLSSVFDLKDNTMVLDEVDELLELMKKTWVILGINKSIHNLCFTWVLFEQYIATGQVEPDLLGASMIMLSSEVASDAKKVDREPVYVNMLANVLATMREWSEKRLVNYHENFNRGSAGLVENNLPLFFAATKILEEDVPGYTSTRFEKGDELADESAGNKVSYFIRSSVRNAFAKMLEEMSIDGASFELEEVSQTLIKLANETEELAAKEKETFSPVLKKWHPISAGVAAVALHSCYGTLLKQYLTGATLLTKQTVLVLQKAGRLEKVLIQMAVEDSVECEDGGKAIVREMVPYEVDLIIMSLVRKWIQERLKKGKEIIMRAKETETWNPKSKSEPYAQSAVDLMRHAKEAVDNFFEIPMVISEDLVGDLADGFEHLFKEYITFVTSCGSKQSYIPTLPPLTRCSQDSRFSKLWKFAICSVGADEQNHHIIDEGNHPRLSTSRGTQRLYIRLNTLHYFLLQLHSLDKTLSISSKIVPSPRSRHSKNRQVGSYSYFDHTRSAIQIAVQHVSEVAAYRLIFFDSHSVFYGSLYVRDVENTRIRPALRALKQNLTLLCAILTDRAQPLALKEVMKASFEAYLMVLLAGGSKRIFSRADHQIIEEDFESLKRVFCTCGDGLIVEDVVDTEAEAVEGVIALMGQSTEQLVEDFSIVACEASGMGVVGSGQKLPMPPTTGRWNRSDANTILRVICHRNDKVANHFLKKTFQLAKRRPY
ncbi:protein unc-13 homolog [Lycium barbarum]|uniref:protein unc-13 homolog n=1 Tax=Lycium barbarum TaxID=112863 RepID=UPI00293E5F0B|nr:protein unc-13 homolog [Lycium barbarum]